MIDSRPFRDPHTPKQERTMAGHSKWANIQHRKNRQDVKRSSLWTKIIREVTVAARDGGPDPARNPRLRLALDKAGLKPEVAEVTMKALAETVLTGDDAQKMQRLLDALEDLDDVQQVYTTAAIEE